MTWPALAVKPQTGGSENAKTTAWVNAVVGAGGTVSAGRRTLINNFFNSMDADSLTSKMNRLWFMAAENTQSAAIDLFNLSSFTLVNSPTFTTDRGYAGNGTSSYINLGTTNAGTQNAAMFGIYNRTNAANEESVSIGSSSAGTSFCCNINIAWSDGNIYYSCNDPNDDAGRTAPATRSGIYIITRTASTTCICYRNGSSLGNTGRTSSGVPNQNYCVGASLDLAGNPDFFTANQFGAAFLGNSAFNATQAANLNTHIQTYMTAVGA